MHIRAETVYIFWVRIYFSRCMIVCACEDVGQIEYDHKAHTECRQLRSISDHIGRGTLTKIFCVSNFQVLVCRRSRLKK